MGRYGYLQDGKNEFYSKDILCVAADAAHVGREDWLRGKVWICPPQAGLFLRAEGLLLREPEKVRVALLCSGPEGRFTGFFLVCICLICSA